MKKKLVKKLIAAAMATTMTMSLAACGGEEATNDTPATDAGNDKVEASTDADVDVAESAEEEDLGAYTVLKDENGNVYDLGGMEIIIRDWWSSGEQEEPKNAYEEARLDYLDWVQETYNFTIKQVGMSDWEGTPQDFNEYASAEPDENNYAFMVWQGSSIVAAMNTGLLYDLSTLDCLDFTEEKWQGGVHNMMSNKDGKIFGMNGGTPEPRTAVFFNKRILEEADINPDDLYKWQESGEWTWDKFAEITKKVQRDLDNDGILDIYGETSQRQSIYCASVYSNGGEFVGKENGLYVNKLETNETLEALNWAMDYINTYEYPIEAGAAWDYYVSVFKEGGAAFCVDDAYRFNDFADMEDDWGVVCFPKGPNMTDYVNVFADNVIAIPACYDEERAWKIAFAYNLWTDPVPGYEDYEGWKSGYVAKSRDAESVDLTLTRMVDNGLLTYHGMIANLELGADILWSLGYADETGAIATPAQKAEALRASWNSYIEKANETK